LLGVKTTVAVAVAVAVTVAVAVAVAVTETVAPRNLLVHYYNTIMKIKL
jgi:hypothetical protein